MSDEEVIILGDFNLKYAAHELCDINTCSARYIKLLLNCVQLIDKPTRVTMSSSTTIDLIYTSMPERHLVSGVVECTISDHFMTYTILQNPRVKRGASRYVTVRDYKHFDAASFNVDLMESNLYHIVNNCSNVNESWNNWSDNVLKVMNKHAPLKTLRLKARSNPWMTRDIITMMYRCDYLMKKAKETKDAQVFREYKCVRNRVVTEIRNAKKKHYTDEI